MTHEFLVGLLGGSFFGMILSARLAIKYTHMAFDGLMEFLGILYCYLLCAFWWAGFFQLIFGGAS